MHTGDVEQQLLDSLGSRVLALNLHPGALLPKSIVTVIGRKRGNLAGKNTGGSPAGYGEKIGRKIRCLVDKKTLYYSKLKKRQGLTAMHLAPNTKEERRCA